MKQKLLAILATLLCSMTVAVSSAQAGDIYTVYNPNTQTLTYRYDGHFDESNQYHTLYDPSHVITPYYDQVLKAVIHESMKNVSPTSLKELFYKLSAMTAIEGLENLNTSQVTDMANMFEDCSSLTAIEGLENLNTSQVTDMSLMFGGCSALTSLDLSSFNTANVTTMNSMFYKCPALESLDLSSFNTAKVTTMAFMFQDCSALTSLDLSSFNTSQVKYMNGMFAGCTGLTSLDLRSFNTANVTDMSYMFPGCLALTTLDLSSFDISKVKNTTQMFRVCSALTTIYCDGDWNSSETLTQSDKMFYGCTSLVGGNGTAFNSSYTDKYYARTDGEKKGYFTKSRKVYTVFDEPSLTLTYRYDNEYDLSDPYHELYDPINNMDAVRFNTYYSIVQKAVIDYSMKDAPLTSARRMFHGGFNEETNISQCLEALTTIEGLQNLNTEIITDMSFMFFRCSALTSLDLTHFKINKVTSMFHMFHECSPLTTIYCPQHWSVSHALTESAYMFYGCTALEGGEGTAYNEEAIDKSYAHVDGGPENPGYFTDKSKTKKVYTVYDEATQTLTYYYPNHELYDPVALRFEAYHDQVKKAVIDPSMKDASLKSMRNMFYGGYLSLSAMTAIEGLENLNTDNVTEMYCMFFGCAALQSLDLSTFNTSNVTTMGEMFGYCAALTSLDLTSFNTANVKNMYKMFASCTALQSIDLSSFDISKVQYMSSMFKKCAALKTIYCADYWNTSATLTYSEGMFLDCTSLVGGEGTAFNSSYTDKSYARLDGGPSAPGYFTNKSKAKKVYTVFDEATQTLTYRYDNSYYLSNPNHELYDPMGSPYAIRFTEYHDQVKKAVIDPSMKDAPLTSMSKMFYGGYRGKNINLSAMTTIEGLENLNTAIVTNMYCMFGACSALTSLNLNLFDTKNVTDMSSMFDNCSSLQTLDLSSFDISSATNLVGMFSCCSELTTIYCAKDWSGTTAASSLMFTACNKLVGSSGTTWSEAVTDASYARLDGGTEAPGYFTKERKVYTVFDETAQTLTYRYDNSYDESDPYCDLYDPVNNPSALRFEAYHDKVLKAVIAPSMKEAPLTSMLMMFYGFYNSETNEPYYLSEMTTIEGLENLNTAIVTDMGAMFFGCTALTSLDLSSFNTANVTDMSNMFGSCSALTSLDLTSFNTAKVSTMGAMFSFCWNLTTLDLSSFDVSKLENTFGMFYACPSLTTIYCDDDWSKSSVLIASLSGKMFEACPLLVGGEGTAYNGEVVDKTYARLDGGPSAPGYFTSKSKAKKVYTVYDEEKQTLTYRYDNSYYLSNTNQELYDPSALRFEAYHDKVKKAVIDPSMKDAPLTSMRNMFYGGYNMKTSKAQSLTAMTTIEGLGNLNTTNVTDMNQMFAACNALTSLNLSAFDTQNVTDMNSMFNYCSSLKTLDVSSFDISNVTNLVGMFAGCSELTTIYCSNDWSGTTALSSSMFDACNKLKGGNGTLFNSSFTNAAYARPDGGKEAPGYFTKPSLIKGDANGDGNLDWSDIQPVVDYIMTGKTDGFYFDNADMNSDTKVDAADLVLLIDKVK